MGEDTSYNKSTIWDTVMCSIVYAWAARMAGGDNIQQAARAFNKNKIVKGPRKSFIDN